MVSIASDRTNVTPHVPEVGSKVDTERVGQTKGGDGGGEGEDPDNDTDIRHDDLTKVVRREDVLRVGVEV